MTLNHTITTSILKENDSNYLSSSVTLAVNNSFPSNNFLTESPLFTYIFFKKCCNADSAVYKSFHKHPKSTNWQAKYYLHNTSLTYYQRRLMGSFYVWVTAKSHHKEINERVNNSSSERKLNALITKLNQAHILLR